jgi:hypothetical protein
MAAALAWFALNAAADVAAGPVCSAACRCAAAAPAYGCPVTRPCSSRRSSRHNHHSRISWRGSSCSILSSECSCRVRLIPLRPPWRLQRSRSAAEVCCQLHPCIRRFVHLRTATEPLHILGCTISGCHKPSALGVSPACRSRLKKASCQLPLTPRALVSCSRLQRSAHCRGSRRL